ncbi:hypothetical protein C1645_829570 [Glomus cerebriforme]|uniref:Uncharacterized protein n=1 Tax=Glomus cerebriforme TaxID=658196 RepID=A0A397SJM8_9GLOM|nr:hypothetical protein C1645_829570 [Glomus cerebriforme]
MSQNQSEASNLPKPSEETKTIRGFSMSLQSSKTKTLGNKNFLKKRRITDDQEEETERQTVEYITVFEDKKSKIINLKKKQTQSKSSKKDTTNKKDNEELDVPEYLTNNSRLSFGLNITKKPTKDPKEKRESILAKIKDFKENQKKEQLIDNEDIKIVSNDKIEPEKSLKEQALEELLKEPKKEEIIDEEQIDRKSSFNLLNDVDKIVDQIKGKQSRKRSRSPSSE